MKAGLAFALAVAWELPLALAQSNDPSQDAPQSNRTPAGESNRFEQLMANPDNVELWGTELKREQEQANQLTRIQEETKASDQQDPLVELMIANNYQLQGISLRHLKRYPEALLKLAASEQVLADLGTEQQCNRPSRKPICTEVDQQYCLLFTYFANVYSDIKDDTNAEKYLKLALGAAPPQDCGKQFFALISWYVSKADYDRALDTIFQTLDSAIPAKRNSLIDGALRSADFTYLKLFYNISWESSGRRRSNDARDFADMYGIGIGRSSKYGMVSPDEDHATFFTVFFTQEQVKQEGNRLKSEQSYITQSGYSSFDELERNVDIDRYVREQMEEDNFEPAAKYLYCRYIQGAFDTDKLRHRQREPATVSFKEVLNKLRTAPTIRVDHNTEHIIELLYRGDKFLAEHDGKP